MDFGERKGANPMKEMEYLEEMTGRYPVLRDVKEDVLAAYELLRDCYSRGGKVLIAGNGGSSADSEHIVGELMKGFVKRRPVSPEVERALIEADPKLGKALARGLQGALPAIALTGHPALSTAFLNDVDGEMIYAQQVYGYGKKGDVFMGLSTSGNAKNIMYAVTAAKAIGMKTIGMTGRDGGALAKACDVSVVAAEQETYKIQELHLPVYHTLCLMLEEHFYEE